MKNVRNERERRYQYTACTAVIGSMTLAMKAQKALAAEAIPSTVVKTEERRGTKGCVYGINYACAYNDNVRRILESAKISVREWNTQT